MRCSTVILDWGGTLMCVLDYPGPMAGWPRVGAVEGAEETLSALRGRCRVIVASNAADSGAADVRRALARAGLDSLVDDVFTPRELGFRKQDPRFWEALLTALGSSAEECIMVGDDPAVDCVPASAAGVYSVWLRPPPETGDGGADAVIGSLTELSDLLARGVEEDAP